MIYNTQISLIEREPDQYVKGVLVQGKFKNVIKIKASVQPASGRDLERFPEGTREKVVFKVFVESNIQLSRFSVVDFNNRLWAILTDADWENAPFIQHNKFYLQRLGDI